ncbi:SDR family NAD(P)-dependent oxidoreductase [Plantactinospora sp. KLBMP9567]|uniref:SDR family NAD(P)-dependent oxidoreductase n=1 Tax=Plantactinospora sp. KLBMP9567 TaxID=3085900 RepID=UPI0029819AD7|nr:SDR family NAD(P)-dependent oxidoreductase [Plantactinospora sp. KLBMP9567]MDW5327854.1 SDR family NAD(P)-dependent oxidoreductase [Plantactinospora sp. KLBMP9567]
MTAEPGPVALVTGGATGIGRATALNLAESGARVVVGYLNSVDAAKDLVGQIGPDNSLAVVADLAEESGADYLVNRAMDKFGRLDLIVNNAGATVARVPVESLPTATWNRALAINLTSAFAVCRAAIPHLRPGSSAIVNVTSSSAFSGGSNGAVHYAAAKAGLVGFTRGLAAELASRRIRVNAVAPASIETEFHVRWPSATSPDSWVKNIPLSRLGSSQDVAGTICFLLSEAASFITGQTIHVNGGSRMY